VKNGVPWEIANGMDLEERKGMGIIFGRFESGKEFDWNTGRWEKSDA